MSTPEIYMLTVGQTPSLEEIQLATKVKGSFRPIMGSDANQSALLAQGINWDRFLFLKYGTDVVGVVSFHVDNKGPYKLGYHEFSQQYNPISGLIRLWGYRLLSARYTRADSYICHFFIKPVARRAGLGSQLLEHWLQHIRQYQVESAELDVFEKNFRAVALYQKCGFRVIKKSSLPLIGRLLPDSSLLRLSISLH